jgi:hypothetical protein
MVQRGRGVVFGAAIVGAMGAMASACTVTNSATPAESAAIPTNGQAPAPGVPRFDSARAWKDLEAQVTIGPRPSGSAALQKTRDYILAELKNAGVEARQQIFIARTPLGETSMANVIATIPGRRPERIALASHFDTKRTPFRGPQSQQIVTRFVGASDGASSTAALLELARALKARQNEFTIELIFFDGEEAVMEWREGDNTYGSRHDRRQGPPHPARCRLDELARRCRLGRRSPHRPPRCLLQRADLDR